MEETDIHPEATQPFAITPDVSEADAVVDEVPEQVEPAEELPADDAATVDEPVGDTPEPVADEPVDDAAAPGEPAEEPAHEPGDEPGDEPVDEPAPEDADPAPAPVVKHYLNTVPTEPTTPAHRGAAFWVSLVALVAFVVLSVAAIVGDFVLLSYVPHGVTIVGRDLANLDGLALRTAIDEHVATPAMQPLTVSGDGRSWQLDPKGIVTVDVDAMVAQAYAPAHKATMLTRLWSRITGEPLLAQVQPVYSVASEPLARWVADTAATVDRAPVDATRTVVKYRIEITPEIMGATVDQTAAVQVISNALTAEAALKADGRTASLPVSVLSPKVTVAKFKKAIVVSISERRVYLYDGAALVKTYRCAPGQPAWPTPKGDFVIVRKQSNAPWFNPHSTWSANMPDMIPGGPGNPMGDRKIGINWPGVFLHGIPPSEYSSIGTAASHGCMRMMPASIHDLYPRVRVGDPVYIRS
jgi:lipoprotein-anchoring transpeptidase ErfK/SrfK